MNRKDQKGISKLYSEAVMQPPAGKGGNPQLAALKSAPEIETIKAEIGNPTGMPLDEFTDLAVAALESAGMNAEGITYNKLFKIIGNALGAEVVYNKGYDDDGYVFADVGFEYGQDITER